jgi:hypothetical protein
VLEVDTGFSKMDVSDLIPGGIIRRTWGKTVAFHLEQSKEEPTG